MNLSKQLTGIIHPMIDEMYVKPRVYKDDENVLVVKSNYDENEILTLLADLKEIQQQVEEQHGHIDRVDLAIH